MPNHCNNRVRIQGDLNKLYEAIGGAKLGDECLLHLLLPKPEELSIPSSASEDDAKLWDSLGKPDEFTNQHGIKINVLHEGNFKGFSTTKRYYERLLSNMEKYGHGDWYSWCINNWGTKWGYYNIDYSFVDEDEILFDAQSAWGPALEGLKKISELFQVTIKTTFGESGCDFAGYVKFVNGQIVYHVDSSVSVGKDIPLPEDAYNKVKLEMQVYVVGDKLTPANQVNWDDVTEWICCDAISYEHYVRLCKDECIPYKEWEEGGKNGAKL